ncbi:lifeguard 1-like, partial [Brachionus plicatilis]
IVTLQLLITVAITALFVFLKPVKIFFYSNSWILWVALGCTLAIMIVLVCCESVSRKYPINIILLMVFTVFESILVGAISAVYSINTVFIALGITSVVVIALTIFAFQTKIDFTGYGIYLFVFAIVLFVFGIVAAILRSQILNILYAALGAGLFSFYLVFDTQLMLGGNHKNSISPEDYIFAALNIYVDIINLFLMILRLVGYR